MCSLNVHCAHRKKEITTTKSIETLVRWTKLVKIGKNWLKFDETVSPNASNNLNAGSMGRNWLLAKFLWSRQHATNNWMPGADKRKALARRSVDEQHTNTKRESSERRASVCMCKKYTENWIIIIKFDAPRLSATTAVAVGVVIFALFSFHVRAHYTLSSSTSHFICTYIYC